MYAEKYKPRVLEEVLGHTQEIAQLRRWLGPIVHDTTRKPVCLIGPPGIGKTTIAHLLAAQSGYVVHELNASDSRTSTVLKHTLNTANTRLQPDLIIIDEVDGIHEHGGVATLTDILKTNTHTPIVLIANERSPKIRTLLGHCIEIRLVPPPHHTIVSFVEKIVKKEGLGISQDIIHAMCNIRDLRSILMNLTFYNKHGSAKDIHYDIFTATQKLINEKHISLQTASNIIESDSAMIPAMLEEAYVSSSKTLETVLRTSNFITVADILNQRIHRSQDWTLFPCYGAVALAAARSLDGPPPFNLFPSWLGKNSTALRKNRDLKTLGRTLGVPTRALREDYIGPLDAILGRSANVNSTVDRLIDLGLSRDDYIDTVRDLTLDPVEIPTKMKTALTRTYNKRVKNGPVKHRISVRHDLVHVDEDLDVTQ